MKRKYLRTLILAVCFAFVTVLFPGCLYKEYSEPYADLYTVAINSVLWTEGRSRSADSSCNSEIEIIENDEFGRTLYRYQESRYAFSTLRITALLVSQYTTDGQVYYYEDCNYIVRKSSTTQVFESEAVEQLKEANDWGKPIDTNKCICKTIAKQKQKNADIESAVIDRAGIEYGLLEFKYYKICAGYLTDDKNGNSIYYGVTWKSNEISEKEYNFFVAFVSAEGDIKLFTPTNLFDYNEELKTFKAENGWAS